VRYRAENLPLDAECQNLAILAGLGVIRPSRWADVERPRLVPRPEKRWGTSEDLGLPNKAGDWPAMTLGQFPKVLIMHDLHACIWRGRAAMRTAAKSPRRLPCWDAFPIDNLPLLG